MFKAEVMSIAEFINTKHKEDRSVNIGNRHECNEP
jgi:hypothetical protein